MLKKLLLNSTWFRNTVADYQRRKREQRRVEHLVSVIFRGGMMRV